MQVGYARTSALHQRAGLDAQVHDLEAAGCDRLFVEQVSSVARRPELIAAMDFVREGDTLVVKRIDRLARSTIDLLQLVSRLEAKGVGVRVLDFGGGELATKSASGRLLVTVLAAVAEAERTMMLERQRAGIAKAKADGKYRGRAPTARRQSGRVVELHASGMGASAIAAEVGISRSSVHRLLSTSRVAL